MENGASAQVCPICRGGHLVRRRESLAFLQWTDRGAVRCRVTIRVVVCVQCKFKTWGSEAEAEIEEAVLQQYSRLPAD